MAKELNMGKPVDQTAEDDLRYGLIVIIWARWSIVVFAFILRMYRAAEIPMLVITIIGLLAVALINFVLHTRILAKRPAKVAWLYLASALDLCLISLITGLEGGLHTHIFLYYYPAVLGFALVFPGAITTWLTFGVIVLYTGICLLFSKPAIDFNGDEAILLFRLMSLLGVAIVGNRYRFVEGQRRAKAAETRQTLQNELKRRSPKIPARSRGGAAL
jgi:hypothetical protein